MVRPASLKIRSVTGSSVRRPSRVEKSHARVGQLELLAHRAQGDHRLQATAVAAAAQLGAVLQAGVADLAGQAARALVADAVEDQGGTDAVGGLDVEDVVAALAGPAPVLAARAEHGVVLHATGTPSRSVRATAGLRPTQPDRIVGERTSPVEESTGPGTPATMPDSAARPWLAISRRSTSSAWSMASWASRSTSTSTNSLASSCPRASATRDADVAVAEVDAPDREARRDGVEQVGRTPRAHRAGGGALLDASLADESSDGVDHRAPRHPAALGEVGAGHPGATAQQHEEVVDRAVPQRDAARCRRHPTHCRAPEQPAGRQGWIDVPRSGPGSSTR